MPAQTAMKYQAKPGKPATEEAAVAGTDPAVDTAAATSQPDAPQDPFMSSQGAGSTSQASQSSQLFKPLPAFKLADPKLLATAPEFQKIATLQQNDNEDKDAKDKNQ